MILMSGRWPLPLIVFASAALLSRAVSSSETPIGGVYSSDTTLALVDSPFAVTDDLTIAQGATLTIESGVELNFQARIRLVVNGSLKAVATSRADEILLRHKATVGVRSTELRLVGGSTPREGRIEVKDAVGGRWGTVCDDFWNRDNAVVVCRHLGFADPVGNDFSTRRFGPGSGDIGLSNVACAGVENSLLDCYAQRWNNSGCTHAEDVGVVCDDGSVGFWGGIVFTHASATLTTSQYGVTTYSSSSVLENVRIMNAGVVPDYVRQSTADSDVAAVTGSGALPAMTNMTILHSRETGIRLLDVHGDVDFRDVIVGNCTGVGVAGRVSRRLDCVRCRIENCTRGGMNLTRIALPVGRPTAAGIPTFDFDSSSSGGALSATYFVGDQGAYFTLKDAAKRDYFRVLETTPGYGLSISFDRFAVSNGGGNFRILNADTGYFYIDEAVRRTMPQAIPGDITADYHRVVVYPRLLYFSRLLGDIKAYVSRHRLETRQVNIVDSSTVRAESGHGLEIDGMIGSLLIARHSAVDNELGGIRIDGQGYDFEVQSSMIQYGLRSYNPNHGFYFNGYFSSASITHSAISDYSHCLTWDARSVRNATVANNTIVGSRSDSAMKHILRGIDFQNNPTRTDEWKPSETFRAVVSGNAVSRIGSSYSFYSNLVYRNGKADVVEIVDNVFQNSKGRVYFYMYFSGNGQRAVIARNQFQDIDVGDAHPVFITETDHENHESGAVIVSDNVFFRNWGRTIVEILPAVGFQSGFEVRSVYFFLNNSLIDNVVYNASETSLRSAPNSVVEVGRTVDVELHCNVFENPLVRYEVSVRVEGTSSLDKIDFARNYWGTADEVSIQDQLFDFDDSNFLARADYFPFLLSSSCSDVAPSSHPRTFPLFVSSSGEVGGQLRNAATLTAAGSPYRMTRDVTILPAGTLTIEAGVTIEVEESTGILVEGTLLSMGTPSDPVIIRGVDVQPLQQNVTDLSARLADSSAFGGDYDAYEYYDYYDYDDYGNEDYPGGGSALAGKLEIYVGGEWRSVCLLSNERPDNASQDKLAELSCNYLNYNRSSDSFSSWHPKRGMPIITKFDCPINATSLADCDFVTDTYSSSSRCLTIFYVGCLDGAPQSRSATIAASSAGTWAGIRFSPTSTISTGPNDHILPESRLTHTVIENAGRWRRERVPAVRALLRSPSFANVTIKNSVWTAFQLTHLHEKTDLAGVVVDGTGFHGVLVEGPRTRDLTVRDTTVRSSSDVALQLSKNSDSLRSLTNYQPICSITSSLSVGTVTGKYIGLSKDDHSPGLHCTVTLQGPPNTMLSLTLVSEELYDDDSITLRDGANSASPVLYTVNNLAASSIGDVIVSSGNSVFVELRTGSKAGAPGFGLYAVALSSRPGLQLTQIIDVNLMSSDYGIYISQPISELLISDVKIKNMSSGGISIDTSTANCTLRNSAVEYVQGDGMFVGKDAGELIIDNNKITNCTGNGIKIYIDLNESPDAGTITSNLFDRNGMAALEINQRFSFSQFKPQPVILWTISNNIFDSNQDGMHWTSSQNGLHICQFHVFGNEFRNQTRYGAYMDTLLSLRLAIFSNTFTGHRGSTGGSLLLRGTAHYVVVRDNLFHQNAGKYVVKFAHHPFTASPFTVTKNRFINNTVYSTEEFAVDDGDPGIVVISAPRGFALTDNHFENPNSPFELTVDIPAQNSKDVTVSVANNYWGTTDEDVIRDRIADFGYCSRLGNAEYFPYLTSASGPPVSSNAPRRNSIFRADFRLGGRVYNDTTIPTTQSAYRYTVVRDISVLPGVTLTIEAGVELFFVSNTGILVEGRLLVQGTRNGNVLMFPGSLTPRRPTAGSAGRVAEGSVRLVNDDVGVAEVLYSGTWKALCALHDADDRYYPSSHNRDLATVVCRQLGFSGSVEFARSSEYVDRVHSDDTWLPHLLCRGTEHSLKQCVNYVYEKSSCHLGALYVQCDRGAGFHNNKIESWSYWSGIRFATSDSSSFMRHVEIYKAGYANAERVAAIQAVGHALELTDVQVDSNAWSGVEFINSPTKPQITRLFSVENKGSGVRLVNTPFSTLTDVFLTLNSFDGLSISAEGYLQPLWQYPIQSPLDICSQSSPISVSNSLYLRYIASDDGFSFARKSCSVTLRGSADHVISIDIMAVQFTDLFSRLEIDGQSFFTRGTLNSQQSLHYVTKSNSATVEISVSVNTIEFLARGDYVLLYVQQHSTKSFSQSTHTIIDSKFDFNLISGIAFNSSRSTHDRSSLSVTNSIVRYNAWNGIDVNCTNGGDLGFGSVGHFIALIRNDIMANGRATPAMFTGRAVGVALSVDNTIALIVKNTLDGNLGGAVSVDLRTTRSETTNITLFDNRIVGNRGGRTIGIFGGVGSSGPRATISSNTISGNSAGTLYDTLFIDEISTFVADNTFFDDLSRHVVYWSTESRTTLGQLFLNNTLYLNVGQTPNQRWTVRNFGKGPVYTGNVFQNPANSYEFAASVDNGQGNHLAPYNWWGTSPSLNEAAKRIRDKSVDPALAGVSIAPLLTTSPWTDPFGCEYGWSLDLNMKYCYTYVRGSADWYSAASYCKTKGASLASIHSANDVLFLGQLIPSLSGISVSSDAWLGLHFTRHLTGRLEWRWSDATTLDYDYGGLPSGAARDCGKLTSLGLAADGCAVRLPFFCKKSPASLCPNSCSKHGTCSRDTCSCYSGWKGSDCSVFDCSAVNNCNRLGTCVGPNQCLCRVGWRGRSCSTSYCNLYSTCHACTRQPGCGWCDRDQACVPGLGVRADKRSCSSWFYYGCYAPPERKCSDRIRDIGCSGPCNSTIATSSHETCQHCRDIANCYLETSPCSGWDEDRCPYGRVTPDYGIDGGPDPQRKIPSHLPNGKSRFRSKRAGHSFTPPDRLTMNIDLRPDVRVDERTSSIYRLLVKDTFNYYVAFPPLQNVFVRQIFLSRQAGAIQDKILSTTQWGSYQLIKAAPARLEEIIKYADFIHNVPLENVFDEAATETLPNADAIKIIANSPTPQLPGAATTVVVSSSAPVYKCRESSTGNIFIALTTSDAAALNLDLSGSQGLVSVHGNGFLERVESIAAASSNTIVRTSMAVCEPNPQPPRIKLQVNAVGSPPVALAPAATGFGGTGLDGILVYENVSPSGLDLAVGDVIVGRPSGPVAGLVVVSYRSVDGSATFVELKPLRGTGVPCSTLGSGQNVDAWCKTKKTGFYYHETIEKKFQAPNGGRITTESLVSYDPRIVMTFRTNHSSPFVTKLGFAFDGSMHLGMNINLNLQNKNPRGDFIQHASLPLYTSTRDFCISIGPVNGPVCIRGEAALLVEHSYSIIYRSTTNVSFSHFSESRGNAWFGTVWRNGVGAEFVKQADFQTVQTLSVHPQHDGDFSLALLPTMSFDWPKSFSAPAHVTSSLPSTIASAFSSTPNLSPESSFHFEVTPWFGTHLESWRCAKGCDFGKKVLISSWTGVYEVDAQMSIDFQKIQLSKFFPPLLQISFLDGIYGRCLPLDDESDCPCECPGGAPCIDNGGVKICQACDCVGMPGCRCTAPCQDGTAEDPRIHPPPKHCQCACTDSVFTTAINSATCPCECTCGDGSKSVYDPFGLCQCGCKCKNCEDSELGPSGCNCPNDKCPTCPEGLEPVWQDCTCSCQSKHGRGGLPPVCSDGWKGPFCDVPDCTPFPFCSDNGVCTIPSGSESDLKPYCVCDEQWMGVGCQIARPRPGGGDPHLQTLDGFNYDFFDIGEFWYCKSVQNDFGVSTRFFKYDRASLIGALAMKLGSSVVAISTPHQPQPSDFPVLRIDGVVTPLSDGLKLYFADKKIFLETFLNSSSQEIVALISFQFSSGVSLTVDVRYSSKMKRQFINLLFSPVASFKHTTEGLCGLMDGDISNDLVGSDGRTRNQSNVIDFAKSWKIDQTFDGSGLSGTWSWNHSNFHKDDTLDFSYTDPNFVPVYSVDNIDSATRQMAEAACKQQGLDGVRLSECVFDVAVTNDTTMAHQEAFQTGCPTQCSGKGRCVDDSCVCLPGWFGNDCNLGSCDNCSLNGDCVSGFCQCHFGWDGPLCDEPATCYGVANCTSPAQGRCKSHDVCQCSVGFTGSSCNEKADCSRLNNCSNHGGCVAHDTCRCDYGWAGVACTVYSCETVGYCSNHGVCVDVDKCDCDNGWVGSGCAMPSCVNVSDCSGNGDCVSPNACECYSGYSGVDCSTPTSCSELNNCSGNGACAARNGRNFCLCYAGYSGVNCSEATCLQQSNCSAHGKCVEVDLCECDLGYKGADCQEFSCEAKNFCSGHGKCLTFDSCTCDPQWGGSDCDIPDCSGVNNCGDSLKGSCIGPDTCHCTALYDGPRCDQLAGINENVPKFNSSSIDISVLATSSIGSEILSLPAMDPDSGKNGRLTYTLSSSDGSHALFRVNFQTGVVTTATSLTAYKGQVLPLILTASDAGLPPLTGDLLISAAVTEPNLHCPKFVGLPPSISVSEAAGSGTRLLSISATDADSDSSPNGIVRYSLDAAVQFEIDSTTGTVTLTGALTAQSYVLRVTASDRGQPECQTTEKVQVDVVLENNAPICSPQNLATAISTAAKIGSTLFTFRALDSDDGAAGRLTYNVTAFGSSSLTSPLFRLQVNDKNGTATVALANAPPIPTGLFSQANFRVTASDEGTRPKSCDFFLTVTLSRPFDFTPAAWSAKVSEAAASGVVIPVSPNLEIQTTLDRNRVFYSLYSADSLPFSIDPQTSVLTVSGILDYEHQPYYDVIVVAKTTEVPGAVALASFRISIENANDNAPKFSKSQYVVVVEEEAKKGSLVLKLDAKDPDIVSGPDRVNYQLTSVLPNGTSGTFVIRESGLYLSDTAVLDFYSTRRYVVVVTAVDADDATLFDTAEVVVVLKEANARWPAFAQNRYETALKENSSSSTSVLTVQALVDGELDASITYFIKSQTSERGKKVNAFSVSNDGIVRVANASNADYEKFKIFNVVIVASLTQPVRRTAETKAVISLVDVNDNAPVFGRDRYEADVTLGEQPGYTVVNVTATDADSGLNGEIVFSLQTEQEYFAISSSSGVLFVARELDVETYDSYELPIAATDRGTPPITSMSTVHITVVCSSSGQCPSTRSEAVDTDVIIGATLGAAGGAVLIVVIVVVAVVVVRKRKRPVHNTKCPKEQDEGNIMNPTYDEIDAKNAESHDDNKATTEPAAGEAQPIKAIENEYVDVEEAQASAGNESGSADH